MFVFHLSLNFYPADNFARSRSFFFLPAQPQKNKPVWISSVDFQCGFSVWISGVNFQCGFPVWIFGVDFRCGFSVWISGVDFSVYFQCGFWV